MNIIGFLNESMLAAPYSIAISNIRLDQLTHVIWSDVKVTSASDATLLASGGGAVADSHLAATVTAGHSYGCKVLASLADSGDGSNLHTVINNGTLLSNLITNLSGLVTTYSLDGIDLDWEYTPAHQDDMTTLIDALYTAIHGAGKLITNSASGGTVYDVSAAESAKLDFINLQTYSSSPAGITSILNDWVAAGYSANKLCPGIFLQSLTGLCTYADIINASLAVDEITTAGFNKSYIDYIDSSFYGAHTATGGNVMWRETQAARDIVDLVKSGSYGGVMVFDVSQDILDSRSLLNVIYNEAHPARCIPMSVLGAL